MTSSSAPMKNDGLDSKLKALLDLVRTKLTIDDEIQAHDLQNISLEFDADILCDAITTQWNKLNPAQQAVLKASINDFFAKFLDGAASLGVRAQTLIKETPITDGSDSETRILGVLDDLKRDLGYFTDKISSDFLSTTAIAFDDLATANKIIPADNPSVDSKSANIPSTPIPIISSVASTAKDIKIADKLPLTNPLNEHDHNSPWHLANSKRGNFTNGADGQEIGWDLEDQRQIQGVLDIFWGAYTTELAKLVPTSGKEKIQEAYVKIVAELNYFQGAFLNSIKSVAKKNTLLSAVVSKDRPPQDAKIELSERRKNAVKALNLSCFMWMNSNPKTIKRLEEIFASFYDEKKNFKVTYFDQENEAFEIKNPSFALLHKVEWILAQAKGSRDPFSVTLSKDEFLQAVYDLVRKFSPVPALLNMDLKYLELMINEIMAVPEKSRIIERIESFILHSKRDFDEFKQGKKAEDKLYGVLSYEINGTAKKHIVYNKYDEKRAKEDVVGQFKKNLLEHAYKEAIKRKILVDEKNDNQAVKALAGPYHLAVDKISPVIRQLHKPLSDFSFSDIQGLSKKTAEVYTAIDAELKQPNFPVYFVNKKIMLDANAKNQSKTDEQKQNYIFGMGFSGINIFIDILEENEKSIFDDQKKLATNVRRLAKTFLGVQSADLLSSVNQYRNGLAIQLVNEAETADPVMLVVRANSYQVLDKLLQNALAVLNYKSETKEGPNLLKVVALQYLAAILNEICIRPPEDPVKTIRDIIAVLKAIKIDTINKIEAKSTFKWLGAKTRSTFFDSMDTAINETLTAMNHPLLDSKKGSSEATAGVAAHRFPATEKDIVPAVLDQEKLKLITSLTQPYLDALKVKNTQTSAPSATAASQSGQDKKDSVGAQAVVVTPPPSSPPSSLSPKR